MEHGNKRKVNDYDEEEISDEEKLVVIENLKKRKIDVKYIERIVQAEIENFAKKADPNLFVTGIFLQLDFLSIIQLCSVSRFIKEYCHTHLGDPFWRSVFIGDLVIPLLGTDAEDYVIEILAIYLEGRKISTTGMGGKVSYGWFVTNELSMRAIERLIKHRKQKVWSVIFSDSANVVERDFEYFMDWHLEDSIDIEEYDTPPSVMEPVKPKTKTLHNFVFSNAHDTSVEGEDVFSKGSRLILTAPIALLKVTGLVAEDDAFDFKHQLNLRIVVGIYGSFDGVPRDDSKPMPRILDTGHLVITELGPHWWSEDGPGYNFKGKVLDNQVISSVAVGDSAVIILDSSHTEVELNGGDGGNEVIFDGGIFSYSTKRIEVKRMSSQFVSQYLFNHAKRQDVSKMSEKSLFHWIDNTIAELKEKRRKSRQIVSSDSEDDDSSDNGSAPSAEDEPYLRYDSDGPLGEDDTQGMDIPSPERDARKSIESNLLKGMYKITLSHKPDLDLMVVGNKNSVRIFDISAGNFYCQHDFGSESLQNELFTWINMGMDKGRSVCPRCHSEHQ